MANSKRKGQGRTVKTKTCSTGSWDRRKLPFRLVTGTHGSENINHTGTNIHPLGFQAARQTMDRDPGYHISKQHFAQPEVVHTWQHDQHRDVNNGYHATRDKPKSGGPHLRQQTGNTDSLDRPDPW